MKITRKTFSRRRMVVGLVLLASAMATYFIVQKNRATTVKNTGIDRGQMSFDERLTEFNLLYKKALVATTEAMTDATKKDEALNASRAAWESGKALAQDFIVRQPARYKHTTDWTVVWPGIAKTLELANEDLLRSDYMAAERKLKTIGKTLNIIRRDNNINSANAPAFACYELVEKIAKAKNRPEAIKFLPALKLKFMELKAYDLGAEYKNALTKVERALSDIENSTDKTFPSYQPLLMPVFRGLFLRFG